MDKSEKWVGVVLRNLPLKAVPAQIIDKLEKNLDLKILSCSKVVQVNEKCCAVVRLTDIEDAERLCLTWNNFKFTDVNRLKVNIHPYSYRKRPTNKLSHHPMFKHIFCD
jgi:hypothetical protein